jgi:hypothetical protein
MEDHARIWPLVPFEATGQRNVAQGGGDRLGDPEAMRDASATDPVQRRLEVFRGRWLDDDTPVEEAERDTRHERERAADFEDLAARAVLDERSIRRDVVPVGRSDEILLGPHAFLLPSRDIVDARSRCAAVPGATLSRAGPGVMTGDA